MKAVILAGGLGTRLSEETYLKPKPMVEIGGKPILWHIMKIYSFYGINDFIICCGYKGYLIKEYFANYFIHTCDITIDMSDNSIDVHQKKTEPWKVTIVDTGEKSDTAGRLKRVVKYIDDEVFCFTYGDGLSDVNIKKLIEDHISMDLDATLTAVKPPGRFGSLSIDKKKVIKFQEKPDGDNAWINGGFFVINKKVLDLILSDSSSWEIDILPILAEKSQLNSFMHEGFWQPMDTLRDKQSLEELWKRNKAPWKHW